MKSIISQDLTEDSLALLESSGSEGIVILKDGQPVARLLAMKTTIAKSGAEVIAGYQKKVAINGDVFSTGIKWDAESGYSYHPVCDQSDADAAGEDRA